MECEDDEDIDEEFVDVDVCAEDMLPQSEASEQLSYATTQTKAISQCNATQAEPDAPKLKTKAARLVY